MLFPDQEPELEKIFRCAKNSLPTRLEGDYKVDMLTGFIPSFSRIGHSKRFLKTVSGTTGFNYIFGGIRFGYFYLEAGTCPELDNLDTIIINYSGEHRQCVRKHNIFTHFLCDKIREVEPETYLGRYYFTSHHELDFIGYFSLIKK